MTAVTHLARPIFGIRARRLLGARGLARAVVTIVLILQVYPLFWILTASLRTRSSFESDNSFSLPTHLTLANFARAFREGDIPTFMVNSAFVTITSDILIVALGMMGAFAVAVLGFRFSRSVLALFL